MLNRIPFGARMVLLGGLVTGLVLAVMSRPVAAAPELASRP